MTATAHMQNGHLPVDRRKPSPLRKAWYAGVVAGGAVLLCVLVLLFFAGPLVNRFIRPRITAAFAEAYPAYSLQIAGMNYSFPDNRFQCDSVALSAIDGTFSGTMARVSVNGIGWMHILRGGGFGVNDCAGSVVDAHDIVLIFPRSHYELRAGSLRASVPDSVIELKDLTLQPSGDDGEFFATSTFRRTRFRLVVPEAGVRGCACLELLQGRGYRIRSARIEDAFLDVLINKDKPSPNDSSNPPMPNEILSSAMGTVQIDSLSIINGSLKYGERFESGSRPGLILFDAMQVLAQGIADHLGRGPAVVIHAWGRFMKAGTMTLEMSIPFASPEFSFQYSGSLGRMEIGALNVWLEQAERMRIKAGVVQAATFEINVASGRASGSVHAVYRDLIVAAINRHTGSDRGFVDGLASFVANTFRLRGTNVPDRSGAMKIGAVKYARKKTDPFFGFAWVALRGGVGDVVGF